MKNKGEIKTTKTKCEMISLRGVDNMTFRPSRLFYEFVILLLFYCFVYTHTRATCTHYMYEYKYVLSIAVFLRLR